MFLVKTKMTFSAAHRLYMDKLSAEQNYALYGKCSNATHHGHNYDLEVIVAGELDPETGMVTNFLHLDDVVRREIFDKVDHHNLNTDVEMLRGLVPTAENMAQRFWEALEPHITQGRLYSISIGERSRNVVTYYGPNGHSRP